MIRLTLSVVQEKFSVLLEKKQHLLNAGERAHEVLPADTGFGFALEDGLLPKSMTKGKTINQFYILRKEAGLADRQIEAIHQSMISNVGMAEKLIAASFLNERSKHNYLQGISGQTKNAG